MAKNILIVVLVIVALGGAAFAFLSRDAPSDTATTSESSDEHSLDNGESESTNNTQQTGSNNSSGSASQSSSASIEIKDHAYNPGTVTVKKGTTVTWTNQDSVRHDVVPDNESDDFKRSELLSKGDSYSFTFDTPGTYTYYCSPHTYMTGTVIVTE